MGMHHRALSVISNFDSVMKMAKSEVELWESTLYFEGLTHSK